MTGGGGAGNGGGAIALGRGALLKWLAGVKLVDSCLRSPLHPVCGMNKSKGVMHVAPSVLTRCVP